MANKHETWELKQMQSLPLAAKIIMTQQRIRQWYEYWDGMVYVGFSVTEEKGEEHGNNADI